MSSDDGGAGVLPFANLYYIILFNVNKYLNIHEITSLLFNARSEKMEKFRNFANNIYNPENHVLLVTQ